MSYMATNPLAVAACSTYSYAPTSEWTTSLSSLASGGCLGLLTGSTWSSTSASISTRDIVGSVADIACVDENAKCAFSGAGSYPLIYVGPGTATSYVIVEITSIKFEDASSTGYGASACMSSCTDLTLNNCDFTNSAASNGGAIISVGSSTNLNSLTISGCSFTSCSASSGSGGAIYASYTTVRFKDVLFQSNRAEKSGGAVYLSYCTSNFRNVVLTSNTSCSSTPSVGGGAIALVGATSTYAAIWYGVRFSSNTCTLNTSFHDVYNSGSTYYVTIYTNCPNIEGGYSISTATKGASIVGNISGAFSYTCTVCDSGTWAGTFSSTCSACAAGKYITNNSKYYELHNSSTDCRSCEAGRYQVYNGQATCIDCAAGKWSSATGYAPTSVLTACTVCSAGTYAASSASSACTACVAGTFLTDPATSATLHNAANLCITCAAGKYSSAAGSATCLACDAGKFLQDNASVISEHSSAAKCLICAAGTYAAATASATCTVCPAGRYNADAATAAVSHDALADCAICPSGKYLADAGTNAASHDDPYSDCLSCSAGTFLADNAATDTEHDSAADCKVCSAGRFSTGIGAASCTICAAGRYLTDTASAAGLHDSEADCFICSAGKYLSDIATDATLHDSASDCISCVAGKYLTDAGVTVASHDAEADCTICPSGSYNILAASSFCTVCSAGTYLSDAATSAASHDSASDCVSCGAGLYLADNGVSAASHTSVSQCLVCPKGSFSAATQAGTCTGCPAGTYNNDAATSAALHDALADCATCPAGRYNTDGTGSATQHDDLADCLICPSGRYLVDNTMTAASHDELNDCTFCETGKYLADPGLTASSHTLASNCVICLAGTYAASTGSATCTTCPAGRYNADAATAASSHDDLGDCTICSSGKYLVDLATSSSFHDDANDCTSCGVGTYLSDNAATAESHTLASQCLVCGAGSYAALPASATCTVCAGGKYLSDAASSAAAHDSELDCASCVAGRFLSDSATSATLHSSDSLCLVCPKGTYSASAASSVCSICPAGRFLADAASSASLHDALADCTICPAGKYNADSSLSAGAHDELVDCVSCVAGKSLADDGVTALRHVAETNCAVCGAGTYADTAAAVSCTICPAGRYNADAAITSSNHDSLADCSSCEAGKYLTDNALAAAAHASASLCLICGAGTYSAVSGASVCTSCALGKYLFDAASTSSLHDVEADCTVCEAGRYSSTEASSSCTSCVSGKYIGNGLSFDKHDSSLDCELCPVGTYAASAGATGCDTCEIGKTSPAGASNCDNCPRGYQCLSGVQTPCLAGKYSSGTADVACQECPVGYKCPGGTDKVACSAGSYQSTTSKTDCITCLAGTYQADSGKTLCSDCPKGHFCPLGCFSPISCGSVALICPAGSSVVMVVTSGYYSSTYDATQGSIPETNRWSQNQCEAGYSCVAGTRQACASGYYQTGVGQSTCLTCATCPAGKSVEAPCKATADTVCTSCPKGKYSDDGLTCKNCALAGEYSSTDGAKYCSVVTAGSKPTSDRQGTVPCPKNYFSYGAKDSCDACASGSFSLSGASSCTACGAGKYSVSSENGGDCVNCPVGTYSTSAANACTACDSSVGFVASSAGSSACELCGKGKRANTNLVLHASTCESCPVGRYSAGGTSTCTECAAGTYSDLVEAAFCNTIASGKKARTDAYGYRIGEDLCPKNTFSSGGVDDCSVCGDYLHSSPGSASCTSCSAGQYFDSGRDDCVNCPLGKYSSDPLTGCLTCEGGFVGSAEARVSCEYCVAGKFAHSQSNSCVNCDAGFFSVGGTRECAPCPTGTYSVFDVSSNRGPITCSVSQRGYRVILPARNGEEPCPMNTFSEGSSDNCEFCLNGDFSEVGASECSRCPKGQYYFLDAGQNTCLSCDAGRYAPSGVASRADCIPCDAAGKYSYAGASSCSTVGAGYKPILPGRNGVVACSANTKSLGDSDDCASCDERSHSAVGAASCDSCEPGKYYEVFTRVVGGLVEEGGGCKPCSAGRFSKNGASSIDGCEACILAGSYSGLGASYCNITLSGNMPTPERDGMMPCAMDTFSAGGADECSPCLGGSHSPGGKAFCEYCLPGRYYDSQTSSCELCAAGTYSEVGGANKDDCLTCDVNYLSSAGKGLCSPCPQYMGTNGSDRTACRCVDSFIRDDVIVNGTKIDGCTCPPGKMLIGERCVACESGKFKEDKGIGSCDLCTARLKGSITEQDGSETKEDCVCPHEHFQNGDTCEPTMLGVDPKSQAMTLNELVVLPGYWRTTDTSVDVRKCPRTDACLGGKAVSTYCNIGNEGKLCNVCAEGFISDSFGHCAPCDNSLQAKLIAGGSFVGGVVVALLFWIIWVKWLRHRKAIWKPITIVLKILFVSFQILGNLPTVIPNLVLPSLFLKFIGYFNWMNLNVFHLLKLGCFTDGFDYYQTLLSMTLTPLLCIVLLVALGRSRQAVRFQCYTLALGISYVVLPSVSTIIFGVFPCDDFDDGTSFMRYDYSLSCLDMKHKIFVIYGIACVVIYPVGVTCIYSWILSANRLKIQQSVDVRSEDTELMTMSFLFDSYKPSMWWFEIFETVRRLALTGALGTIRPGTFEQLVAGCLLSYIGTLVYCICQPYFSFRANGLAILSNAQVFIVVLTAMAYRYKSSTSNAAFDSSELGIMLCVFVSLGVGSLGVLAWLQFFVKENKEGDLKSRPQNFNVLLDSISVRELWRSLSGRRALFDKTEGEKGEGIGGAKAADKSFEPGSSSRPKQDGGSLEMAEIGSSARGRSSSEFVVVNALFSHARTPPVGGSTKKRSSGSGSGRLDFAVGEEGGK